MTVFNWFSTNQDIFSEAILNLSCGNRLSFVDPFPELPKIFAPWQAASTDFKPIAGAIL